MEYVMRAVTKYSESIKASVLAKVFAPNPRSIVELAKEFNIPIGTIYTWKFKMRKKPNINKAMGPPAYRGFLVTHGVEHSFLVYKSP